MAHSTDGRKQYSRRLGAAPTEEDVYTLAKVRLHRMHELFDIVPVSFSGGKDSMATLYVAIEVARELGKLPVPTYFYDQECIPFETVDYVKRIAAMPEVDMRWICLPIQHRNACSLEHPYWYPWDTACPEKWVRELPECAETIDDFPNFNYGKHNIITAGSLIWPQSIYGNVCSALGVRADESVTRRWNVSNRVEENYITKKDIDGLPVWLGYPIYDWRTTDIWGGAKKFGWDYNRAYDLMGYAGLTPMGQRITSPFGEQPVRSLWTFKTCFPDMWDLIHDRVPGSATACMYSTTSLYAYGKVPDKPPEFTWPEFVEFQISRLKNQKIKVLTSRKIRNFVARHKKKTDDPILSEVPHYATGMSWKFLTKIAIKGDTKRRAQELSFLTQRPREENYRRYMEAKAKEYPE